MAVVMAKLCLLKYLASQSLTIYCSFSLIINKTSLKILLHCAGLINYANAGAFKAATQSSICPVWLSLAKGDGRFMSLKNNLMELIKTLKHVLI